MTIAPASQNNFSSAIALLKESGLPTEDITAATQLFVAEQEDEVIGTVALEHDRHYALLRSLSVIQEKRNSGVGAELVGFVESYAKKQDVTAIYILTTTAERFFSNRSYRPVPREEVPSFIKNTSEFRSVCPASSTIMLKQLS